MSALLSSREVAVRLGVKVQTLANWRAKGNGPAFVRISSNKVRYTEDDVQAWIDARRVVGGGDHE